MLLGLLSPLWGRLAPYLIAGAVGMAVLVGAYQTGVRAERKRGEAVALRAEIATLKADIAIARVAEADAATRAAAIEAASAADQKIVEEVRNAPSTASCVADPAGARRVQSIGQGRAGR
ncbi:MAG: hypothetical protein ACK4NE_00180 [Albidovulum sp.]